MKSRGLTVVKNAISNLVRGGAAAIVAFMLPHFLVQVLSSDRFDAWSLILQVAAYAGYLDFGLQTAVSRFVAQAIELDESDRLNNVIGTALSMLSGAALLALLLIGGIVFFAGAIFHGVPSTLLSEFKGATLIMAAGTAIALPLSTYTGVLVGMHDNEFTALAIGGSRLIGAAAAIIAANHTHALWLPAACLASANVIGGLLQMAIVSRRLPRVTTRTFVLEPSVARSFLRYCSGLTVWSLGMLLVSGLDVTIVGHYDFKAVGYYAICTTLITMFSTANGTVMSAFLAPFSVMHARGNYDETRKIVIKTTRINTALNCAGLGFAITYGSPILRLWVGSIYAQSAYPILIILLATQTIRLMGSSFSIALMATEHQNDNVFPSLIEGAVNLIASIWAATHFGPIGVAFGSLLGAAIAIPAVLTFAVRVRNDLTVSRYDLGVSGILMGLLQGIPFLFCAVYLHSHSESYTVSLAAWIGVSVLAALPFLLSKDKHVGSSWLGRSNN